MPTPKRTEELRKEHVELLDQLREVYEESPELMEGAPEGMMEWLYPDKEEEADSALDPPEPPAPDDLIARGDDPPPTPDDLIAHDDDPPPTAGWLIYEREAEKATRRRERLHRRGLESNPWAGIPRSKGWDEGDEGDEGGEPPDIDVSDAEEAGVRDQERDDLREMSDVAFNMREYNRQLVGLLSEMQEILLDGIAEMETMRARFHRMR